MFIDQFGFFQGFLGRKEIHTFFTTGNYEYTLQLCTLMFLDIALDDNMPKKYREEYG